MGRHARNPDKILVIDDDPSIGELMSEILETELTRVQVALEAERPGLA